MHGFIVFFPKCYLLLLQISISLIQDWILTSWRFCACFQPHTFHILFLLQNDIHSSIVLLTNYYLSFISHLHVNFLWKAFPEIQMLSLSLYILLCTSISAFVTLNLKLFACILHYTISSKSIMLLFFNKLLGVSKTLWHIVEAS